MTEKCETKWSPTEDQIDNIIIPAMQGTAQQYSKYATELQCPPAFIALIIKAFICFLKNFFNIRKSTGLSIKKRKLTIAFNLFNMVLTHILKYWCNHPKKLRIALQQRLSSLARFS